MNQDMFTNKSFPELVYGKNLQEPPVCQMHPETMVSCIFSLTPFNLGTMEFHAKRFPSPTQHERLAQVVSELLPASA
jgi:hypothetical protein